MDTLNYKAGMVLSTGGAGAIAYLAWHTSAVLIPLALVFPALALAQRDRIHAASVVLVYYGVSSLPVLQVSAGYFGRNVLAGLLPWAIGTGLLAAPWIVLWGRDPNQTWWRMAATLLVTTAPPIGIIGWASPLTATGLIFPGLGWLGILLGVLAMVGLALRSWSTIITVALLSLAANLSFEGAPPPRSDWIGVNTTFGNIHAPDDPLVEFSVAEQIQKTALTGGRRVIVFPEMVVRRWGHATDLFWQPTFDSLRAQGSTILFGARLPSQDSMDEYRNAVIIRGTDDAPSFQQRIPVPLAMWKPWGGKDRVRLNLFGPSTIQHAGERAAILICYEQLLPWSYLSALWQEPTVIIGLSNAYWTKTTVIPANQSAALQAWGRLFNLPVISATNH